ncbi:DUF3038 domain-containing protein [Acaryochloris sp. IP29b_bin.148]|uniref:DUF3038 domain-containing protein n=1 Tax=Acaryochloris sp. IP29b_bin.148 TaxID=2969218 RepID=UPI00261F8AB8|nr:DUF3038 domain-containing protein [Acaryochloris sp. IP29b_bin.148]
MDIPLHNTTAPQGQLVSFPLAAQTQPSRSQLDNIKAQLDLVLLALEALLGIGSEAVLQAAIELNLQDVVGDRVALWRLRQSNPLRRGTGGRKKLDIEEALSLVMISCYLAQQHQAIIREAVGLLETLADTHRQPHQVALLGDYLDNFTNTYQDRMTEDALSTDALTDLALKLLIDLLFYSNNQGPRRLWMALLDRASHPAT